MAQGDYIHAAQRMAEAMKLFVEGAADKDQGFVKMALREGAKANEMVKEYPYHVRRIFERQHGMMVVEANQMFEDFNMNTRIEPGKE